MDTPFNQNQPLGGSNSSDLTRLIAAAQATTQAINKLQTTIAAVFPQGNAVALSAGGANGKYLVVQLPDGTTGKLQILSV